MNNEAASKIAMLKGSQRCFAYGLLGLLPAFGLPFAFAALWISGRVRIREELHWNAAKPYRMWGVFLASAGTFFWILVAVLIAYNSISHGGGTYDLSGDD